MFDLVFEDLENFLIEAGDKAIQGIGDGDGDQNHVGIDANIGFRGSFAAAGVRWLGRADVMLQLARPRRKRGGQRKRPYGRNEQQ